MMTFLNTYSVLWSERRNESEWHRSIRLARLTKYLRSAFITNLRIFLFHFILKQAWNYPWGVCSSSFRLTPIPHSREFKTTLSFPFCCVFFWYILCIFVRRSTVLVFKLVHLRFHLKFLCLPFNLVCFALTVYAVVVVIFGRQEQLDFALLSREMRTKKKWESIWVLNVEWHETTRSNSARTERKAHLLVFCLYSIANANSKFTLTFLLPAFVMLSFSLLFSS